MDGNFGMGNTTVIIAGGLFETLLELRQRISDSMIGAQAYLESKFKLADPGNPSLGGGWSQFLNEQERTPSVTGTAHGIISLIACGKSSDSEMVELAKQFIANSVRPDGGWTKPALFNYCSLVRVSCLALRSLLDAAKLSTSPVVMGGIAWLLKAQNDDGGWGNIPNDQMSDVTSTSFALQTLTRIPVLHQEGKKAINQGKTWLLTVKSEDHSWGYANGKGCTIAQTSEAIEGLIATGESRAALSSTHEWLVQHIDEDAQFVERYLINIPPIKDTSIDWTQASRERGLIALLKLGSNITAPEVINSVREILDRQVDYKYWRIEVHPGSEPIWALKEAVISLRLYHDLLERDQTVIALLESLSSLRGEADRLQTRIDHLEDHIRRSSLKARLLRFLSFMRKPGPLVIWLTVLLVGIYILLRDHLALPQYAEILFGVLAIVGVTLTLYQIMKPSKPRDRGE